MDRPRVRPSPRAARPSEDKEFNIDEVDSIYVDRHERYVVSLVVAYDGETVRSARHALAAALDLTRDAGSRSTLWFVFDRVTGQMMTMEQSDFELAPGESLDDFELDHADA